MSSINSHSHLSSARRRGAGTSTGGVPTSPKSASALLKNNSSQSPSLDASSNINIHNPIYSHSNGNSNSNRSSSSSSSSWNDKYNAHLTLFSHLSRRRRRSSEKGILFVAVILLTVCLFHVTYCYLSPSSPSLSTNSQSSSQSKLNNLLKPRSVALYSNHALNTNVNMNMNAKNNANTDESESHDTSLKLNFKVSYQQISVLDIYAEKYPSKRKGFQSKSTKERQDDLKKSKKYPTPELDIWETKDCKAMHPWQLTSFPTCNKLHEVDLSPHHLDQDGFVRIINHGYFRDVWTIHDDDLQHTPQVLKTLRYEHKYIDRNYDRHRRDAVAMERLTGSPYIVDIFGYCGNNGLFEYSPGGDIDHALFSKSSLKHPMIKYDRLRIAAQVANGIADAHHVDDQGRATIAHTDITGGQFVYVDGIFKLNDFNRARFLRFDSAKNETCGFRVGANRGDFRAPEEYAYTDENEKVDVYSMGNIFFQLATMQYYVFGSIEDDKIIKEKVVDGERPDYKALIGDNPDEIDKVFMQVMEMCYKHDPKERSPARDIANYILDALKKIPFPEELNKISDTADYI